MFIRKSSYKKRKRFRSQLYMILLALASIVDAIITLVTLGNYHGNLRSKVLFDEEGLMKWLGLTDED